MAYTLMNPCPWWGTLKIEVVTFISGNIGLENDGVHQAVRRIHLGSHGTIKIVEKHATGVCLWYTTLSCELLSDVLGVIFDVLYVCQNGLGLVQ